MLLCLTTVPHSDAGHCLLPAWAPMGQLSLPSQLGVREGPQSGPRASLRTVQPRALPVDSGALTDTRPRFPGSPPGYARDRPQVPAQQAWQKPFPGGDAQPSPD